MPLKRDNSNKIKVYHDPVKEKIAQRVIHNLMSLPAYRLDNKSRKIFERYEYEKINLEISRTTFIGEPKPERKDSATMSLYDLYKRPKIGQKTWFYLTSLSQVDKNIFLATAISLLVASIVKFGFSSDNPWFFLTLVLSVLVFQICSLILNLRLYVWQINFDSTFSAIHRHLDVVYRYVDDLGEVDKERIQFKVNMISENLIKEEICDLDYRMKKVNVFAIIFSFFIVLFSLYMAGDSYIRILHFVVKKIGFQDFEIIKNLTTERLAVFVMFPLGLAIARDVVVSALQARSRKLRRSLSILRDRLNDQSLMSK